MLSCPGCKADSWRKQDVSGAGPLKDGTGKLIVGINAVYLILKHTCKTNTTRISCSGRYVWPTSVGLNLHLYLELYVLSVLLGSFPDFWWLLLWFIVFCDCWEFSVMACCVFSCRQQWYDSQWLVNEPVMLSDSDATVAWHDCPHWVQWCLHVSMLDSRK